MSAEEFADFLNAAENHLSPKTSVQEVSAPLSIKRSSSSLRSQSDEAVTNALTGENDSLSDEDDVFVPEHLSKTTNKPLLAPRPKTAAQRSYMQFRKSQACQRFWRPMFLFGLTFACLIGVFFLITVVVKFFQETRWKSPSSSTEAMDWVVEEVWAENFPKLSTESAIRLLDVNSDGIRDVVIGFATGADGYEVDPVVCDVYFNETRPCFGGVLALDGRTGAQLWRHYTDHEVFALSCEADLDQDGTADCLAAGRAGVMQAVSGIDGQLLWNFGHQRAKRDVMNLYTAQIVRDLDGDGVLDVLAVHGGDPLKPPGSKVRLDGRLLLMSGATGQVLKWSEVPDGKEAYYSPQVFHRDGLEMVLYGTGGETHGGSLYLISLKDLYDGKIEKSHILYTDKSKGMMAPPVLVDVSGDGVEDIVIATFHAAVIAIDGATFTVLWRFEVPGGESYSSPSPGFWNDDSIPDFLIKYSVGPGFPIYYHALTTVLDGRTGRPLLQRPLKDTIGSQASGLTVSMQDGGGKDGSPRKSRDSFLFWTADCVDHEATSSEFDFAQGTNIHEQSRADFCKLRFNSMGISRLNLLSPSTGGASAASITTHVYDSVVSTTFEHANAPNSSLEALNFVRKHEEYHAAYDDFVKQAKENAHNKLNNLKYSIKASGSNKDGRGTHDRSLGRPKRHVGTHDYEGIQRLISTGTLAPVLLPGNLEQTNASHSIDVIFAVYWFFPAKTQGILPADRECVKQRMDNEKERFEQGSVYLEMDHDQYESAVTRECLEKSGHLVLDKDGGTYQTQTEYNPFAIHMGQMTVYRKRLSHTCAADKRKKCPLILPYDKQAWPAYMGLHADSHYNKAAAS